MRSSSLMIAIIIAMTMCSFLSLAHSEENKLVDIASVTCDRIDSRFTLRYIQGNDDFFSEPILPKNCRLNHSVYKIIGKRGPFGHSHCGAEPPVSITVIRNGKTIITDPVFGGNCFGGPSIAEVEITEKKDTIVSIKLCIYKEYESPINSSNEFTSICKYFRSKVEIRKALPITQGKLNDFIRD